MADRNPSELARETFKLLASRRLPPTPNNYQALYDEIAGINSAPAFPEGPLRQIARVLPGQTPAQKRLLGMFENAVAANDWAAMQGVLVGYANLGLTGTASASTTASAHASLPESHASAAVTAHLPDELAEQLVRLVDTLMPALGEDDARVHELAAQLIQFLKQPSPPASTLQLMLNNFSYRLSFATEDQAAIRTSLLALLQMVFENIAALSLDDQWLHGQVEALIAASTPPLTLRRLDDVQRRLKDVIFKQTEAKTRLLEAQDQMKELLAAFIDRLAQMDQSSNSYHDTLEDCAERIGQATQLQQITPLLERVMSATRAMAVDSRVARDELHHLRERSEVRHAQIAQLQQALNEASAQARHDPLTGSLNRKGLDEVMEREIARARRNDAPLCVALLDLDNFKAINDRLGHSSGDQALVHLATVAREVMRPQDMLARYGGEEFVLVLPDTALPQGVDAMTRLQRELTTRYFMREQEKVLITFSAGVAQLAALESSDDAIRRADQGMYLAKRAGKNRVTAA